jgi:glycerol-1-phosphate dehydrogenase [NAD(P)+]
MEALIISGIAIGFVGYSRPASGAEHHLAHYWEMDAISKNIPHPLHGNSVGVGTVVVSMIYQLMKDKLPKGLTPPDPQYLISIHKKVGSIYTPKELDIPKDVFQDSIIHAREIRNRYTILQLAHEFNLLEKISTILTEKFYG